MSVICDLIGKNVILPLVDREIPVVGRFTMWIRIFGTGAVKITPAHDPNDFEVGKRHNLPEINVMNDDAYHQRSLAANMQAWTVMRQERQIVADLDAQGYLVKVSKIITHAVGTHDRCKTTVEPMIKQQWFVAMEEMAKPAINAIKTGELKFVPESL